MGPHVKPIQYFSFHRDLSYNTTKILTARFTFSKLTLIEDINDALDTKPNHVKKKKTLGKRERKK